MGTDTLPPTEVSCSLYIKSFGVRIGYCKEELSQQLILAAHVQVGGSLHHSSSVSLLEDAHRGRMMALLPVGTLWVVLEIQLCKSVCTSERLSTTEVISYCFWHFHKEKIKLGRS